MQDAWEESMDAKLFVSWVEHLNWQGNESRLGITKHRLVCLFVCLFVFRDRVFLNSPGCPGTRRLHLPISSGSTLKGVLGFLLWIPLGKLPHWCDSIEMWDSTFRILWWVRHWMRKKMWNLETQTKPQEYKLVFNWRWIALFSTVLGKPPSRK